VRCVGFEVCAWVVRRVGCDAHALKGLGCEVCQLCQL